MIPFPPDVLDWLRTVFAGCNRFTTDHISQQPNVYETALDMSFINYLSRVPPRNFESNWSAHIKTHFLGAKALWGKWEVADIGLLIMYRSGPVLKRTKVALLQSKRLYPDEQPFKEDEHHNYMVGFARLYVTDPMFAQLMQVQQFSFQPGSQYKSVKKGDRQEKTMKAYAEEFEIPIYYLFYNPAVIPWTTQIPVHADTPMPQSFDIGCRVVPVSAVRSVASGHEEGRSPSFSDLHDNLSAPFDEPQHRAGWSLESFFVDELCACNEGKRVTPDDEALFAVFNTRSGPISGAISINISAPNNFDWGFDNEQTQH